MRFSDQTASAIVLALFAKLPHERILIIAPDLLSLLNRSVVATTTLLSLRTLSKWVKL